MTGPGEHEPVALRRLSTDPVIRIPPATPPAREALDGRLVRLEPLDAARHAAALFRAGHGPGQDDRWRFLPYGPFVDEVAMRSWIETSAASKDPMFFAVCSPSGEAMGMTSYLNIHPSSGSIEAGHIWFGSRLQRTPAATEAIFLMMRHAMERGFRRFEWKCDAANRPSRAAARRFGFQHEGIFYRATVVKGRNRDTAWYSVIEEEWPRVRAGFEAWLDPANFSADGSQRRTLAACRGD
ncbi:MAG TPA: GNAT family protein [Geminicoccus sp.]|uniref:GNAT family N-acetyltransferase n=1 Tax=Geminicoccus sp. TaxID=2024832 RepID=UPI002E305747|nr:GNAT family protein [Geminicoccus sp.]HEX2527625.1 GNAT family protein [Geminicoccus sp.]